MKKLPNTHSRTATPARIKKQIPGCFFFLIAVGFKFISQHEIDEAESSTILGVFARLQTENIIMRQNRAEFVHVVHVNS